MTRVKKVSKKNASPSQKTAKVQTRMAPKQARIAPKIQERNLVPKGEVQVKTVKTAVVKSPSLKKGIGQDSKASIFPAEFFAVMDELDQDAKKRRVAALKVMKKVVEK